MAQDSRLSPRLSRLKETLSTKHLSGTDENVQAVVAVLLQEETSSDLNILLIHRAERIDDPWSGQIGLPGGRVERSDPSARAALRREVSEEIGLDLDKDGDELGTLSLGSPMRRLEMKVQPWVYGLRHRREVRTGPEVQEAFWVSLARLPSLRTTTKIEIRGTRRSVEAFLVDGRVVWGFTHRVLEELLSVQDEN
ncbi:CoA pyrophosphatase [Candidatus Bathyarchaeota archaeon]|nr:MAG: CoA pyrophosphatase [Candidatus Bathyarchaeota archaeon]